MADVFDFYVHDDRRIDFRSLEPIMQEDKDVTVWRFRIPKVLNQVDMTNWAWWFVYTNARGQKFSKVLMLSDDIDEPGIYNSAEISIDHGISIYPGNITFALEAIEAVAGGGEIIGEWHTYTYTHKVVGTLQGNQAEFAETESDIISALIVEVQNKVNSLVGGATPQVVSSVSDMTDTSKIYVLSTDGNWYYYNDSTWQSGGQYASGIIIDPTLSESGQAADAKVTGEIKIDLNNGLEINRYCENNNVLTLPSFFAHGSRTGENAVSTLTYRITSKSKISVENEETYSIASGFRIRSYVWDKETGNYIGANNWTSSDFTLNPNREYMINIARVTEDTSEVADIAYFAKQVYKKSLNVRNDYIKEIVSTEQTTRMNGDYLPCAFRRGSYGSDGKYAEADNRICSINTVEVDTVRVYTIADGFECRVTSVNDDGSVIASQVATQTLTLNLNKKYQLTIKRAVESDVIENINELYSAVKRGTPVILYPPCKLIHGSRGTNGDLYTTGYDYRVTSSDKFRVTRRTEYVISDGFKCRLTSFDDNGNMLATQSNIMGKLTLNTDRNYVLTILRTTEDSTEIADIEEFKNAVCRNNSGLNKGHLRIMVFGHSYSADSWQYVPFLLQKYGITCEIYLYYRGNDSINRLVAEWNETGDTGWDDFGIGHIRRYCHVDTRYCNSWDSSGGLTGYSPKMVLELAASEGKLDLITLQTAPTEVYFTKAPGAPDPRKGYEPYVRQAIELINASYKDTYTLGWFCSYTRILPYEGNTTRGYPAVSGNEFDNRIGCLKAAETIWKAEPFEMIIPAAAAIFNARTNQGLASTTVSAIGNLWYSDAVHLQAGIPSYIANLTVLQSIFNKFFPGCSVLGEQTRITDNLASSWNAIMPSIHGNVMSTSEELYELAQKCAVLACEHPFDITPIYAVNDTTELELYDTHNNRYWADALIDTSLIQDGQVTLSEQSGDA